jgi:hypothetical protein
VRLRGWGVLWLLAFVALWAYASWLDRDRLYLEQLEYCQMHALWLDSAGDKGWPDYNGTFDQYCTREGGVKGRD